MKRSFPLLLAGLILTGLLLTVTGALGKTSVYAGLSYDAKKAPLLSLSLNGLREGISPLSAWTTPGTHPAENAEVFSENSPLTIGATNLALGEEEPEEEPVTEEDTDTAEEVAQSEPEEDPARDEQEEDPENAEGAPLNAPRTPPAAPAGAPADDSYYADALFIGDSRTVGLSQYCPGLDAYATFYCQVSLTIYGALDAVIAPVEEGIVSVEQALSTQSFGKIYLMVGINEIGGDPADFVAKYAQVVARIRELQPDAVIYIQSIMHVSSAKEMTDPVFSNVYVNERNAALELLANGDDIVYIDINYLIDDENGALNADLTFDGVHLTAGAYDLWYQAIRAQTR